MSSHNYLNLNNWKGTKCLLIIKNVLENQDLFNNETDPQDLKLEDPGLYDEKLLNF
jgi:hypothetical protein